MVAIGPKLQELLKKKHLHYILLDVAFCKSCGGAVGELYARPIKVSEAQRITGDGKAYCLPCSDTSGVPVLIDDQSVELVVANPNITLEEEVTFEARRFFGTADLIITGARF